MSTYPLTIYVFSDGEYVGASNTDQHHVSGDRYKRVRTSGGRLCLSAGMWDPSQLEYQPFRDAVAEAARECAEIEARGFTIMPPREPIISPEDLQRYFDDEGRRIGEKGRKALRLVACEGFDYTNAARVSGLNKPEVNGRIQVKRLYRALKNRMNFAAMEIQVANGEG